MTGIPTGGRHRHPATPRIAALVSAVVAVAAAVTLLALPSPGQRSSPAAAPAGPPTLQSTWRDAGQLTLPGTLDDGGEYTPRAVTADGVPVGTAPDGRGNLRLLVGKPGATRELHRLPANAQPGYSAVIVSGGQAVWAVTMPDDAGVARSAVWTAALDGSSPARRLTTGTGDMVFFNSEYDLVVAGGRVYWIAAAPTSEPTTEVRSVPLAGGDVRVQRIAGAFALSAWPWLVSAGNGQTGSIELRDLLTGRRIPIPGQPNELIACSPTWCRRVVLGNEGSTRLDLSRRDGRDRHTIAGTGGGNAVSPGVSDVALLDRFEVLTTAAKNGGQTGDQRLFLYDVPARRAVLLHEAVGVAGARGGWLWWSTGTAEATQWTLLDLRSLR